MAPTDTQIDRYSRQILVIGGIAQERLLAARVALSGRLATVATALRYLVGAGIGQVDLEVVGGGDSAREALIDLARKLNRAAKIDFSSRGETQLASFLVDDAAILDTAQTRLAACRSLAAVVARMDDPARIIVLPASDRGTSAAELGASWRPAGAVENAGFVIMVAMTEALKLLTEPQVSSPRVIEFEGYATNVRELRN